MFSTDLAEITAGIHKIDPIAYGRSRNFIDGAVTRLSPYISRGLISPRQVLDSLFERGYLAHAILPFIKELAWREYFQRVWQSLGVGISRDIRQSQPGYQHRQISRNLILANTGIDVINTAIHELYTTGYLHNHLRMYLASMACNIAKAHWLLPAQWMYFHLLDAD